MRREELLVNRLMEYGKSDMYPFHMPGHKRAPGRLPGDEAGSAPEDGAGYWPGRMPGFPDPYTIDITEIAGFDNLHHPEGILKDSMEWAAGLYGADETYYLVNGSTSGILSAVCGTVPRGGRILISRNCHKSVYHGIYLSQLKASYVYPHEIEGLGIQGGITAEDVDKMLKRYMDTQAVLIVSPTYDGVVSDIEAIARVVHGAGLPLIVDEAHGAHFRFGDMFPVSALELGADAVVQSVHKTMPSLTQTALLHIRCSRPDGGCYADREGIDRYVHMVQSSSPSYVLMAGIEKGIYQMEHMDMEPYRNHLRALRDRLASMTRLRLVDADIKGQAGVYDLDVSKIVVSTRGSGLTGAALDDILRREYHLEMEMCGADYVTAITTAMDSPEGIKRLGDALVQIDCGLRTCREEICRAGAGREKECRTEAGPENGCRAGENQASVYSMRSDTAMTICDAMDAGKKVLRIQDSEGCVSGEFVYIYPPGIPIIAPGEWISRRILDVILGYIEAGLPVQGPSDPSLKTIRVVDRD